MAKPVIVSDAIPIKRIVQETNSGVYFKSGDAEDQSNAMKNIILILAKDLTLRWFYFFNNCLVQNLLK
ncbi:MAG: hypothetical protein IPH11_10165 [Ignavibacteriales bacterium]|nr:hypothetical protein [Ignavibacteriales bacterium]